jgi:hypothetical protein
MKKGDKKYYYSIAIIIGDSFSDSFQSSSISQIVETINITIDDEEFISKQRENQ